MHVDGLIHLRARDYDPTVGMFTTLDPLDGLDGQVTVANGYHYAANDPVNRTDPTGLTPFADRSLTSRLSQHIPGMQSRGVGPPQSRVGPAPTYDRCFGLYGTCNEIAWDIGRSNTNFWAGLVDYAVLAPVDFLVWGADIPRIGPVYEGNHVEVAHQIGGATGVVTDLIGGAGAIRGAVRAVQSVRAAGGLRTATTDLVNRARTGVSTISRRLAGEGGSLPGRAVGQGGAGPVRTGQAGEAWVRARYDIGDKTKIFVNGRGRIPDGITPTTVSEVKNVKTLSYTQQLRDYVEYARQTGRTFDLYVRRDTIPSKPLLRAVDRRELRLLPVIP